MATRPSVFFFFNYGNQGWMERYWYSSVSAPLPTVATAGKALLLLRSKMLAKGPTIVNAYASYDDVFRDYQQVDIPAKGSTGLYNAAISIDAAQPNDCIVGRGFSGDRAGKDVFISGIPYSATIGGEQYNPDAALSSAFKDAWDAFRDGLIGVWGWKAVTYDPVLAPITAIQAMAASGDAWQLTVASVVGFTVGKKVKVSGATFTGKAVNRGNRVYRVGGIGPGQTMLLNWGDADLVGLDWAEGGNVQLQAYVVLPFTGLKREKLGTHKRGVGFGRQVGRRRVP